MANHKLTLTFDEATGALTVRHRTTVSLAGHDVHHWEDVTLADEAGAKAALKSLLDGNRAEMEQRATEGAVQHVAAVTKQPKAGRKQLAVGGNLGALGGAVPRRE